MTDLKGTGRYMGFTDSEVINAVADSETLPEALLNGDETASSINVSSKQPPNDNITGPKPQRMNAK